MLHILVFFSNPTFWYLNSMLWLILHTLDALTVRVIQTWIEQATIRRSLAVEEERIEVLQRIESILVERYKDGIGSLDEYSTAKSRTEIAIADLSEYKIALLRAVRLLEV